MYVKRIAVLLCALLSSPVSADVVEYENEQRDQWFADVGGASNVSTVDFTGFPEFTQVSDQWDHLGVNFSGLVVIQGPSSFAFPNDGWGIGAEPEILIDFDEPMQWIGTDFPGTLSFELFNGGSLIYSSGIFFPPGSAGGFAGLISDQPFDSVRIYDPLDNILFLDDLHFGPPINVPAPGALVVMCSAALVRRRRRRG